MEEPVILGRAESPRGEVVLRRVYREGEQVVELRVNGVFVMDDAETTSERALASLALSRSTGPRRVLIGGLGLGFTLAEVLRDDRVEHVTVVEIEAAVAEWMADGTIPHGPALLADPRVEVIVDDVADVIAERAQRSPERALKSRERARRSDAGGAYDLVLLDVDNGPAYLVHESNADLYRTRFLTRCRDVISPGGLLAIWSMTREEGLLRHLADRAAGSQAAAFNDVEAVAYDVRLGERVEKYWLHLAQRT